VTTPAAQTQPPQQQAPQQQQDDTAADAALIALIVAALAAYGTAQALTGALKAPFKAAGISGAALSAIAALAVSAPQDAVKGTGPASRWALRNNLLRRAQFVLAASRRVQQAVKAARSQNEPAMTAIRDALATEKQYLGQHIAASEGRVDAASSVDSAAAKHGKLLGWQATKDKRCTPGCAAASGSNFKADRPPIVEGHPAFPGMVHGATCRCIPVAPFKGAKVLPSS
jgi:hypothetical protein